MKEYNLSTSKEIKDKSNNNIINIESVIKKQNKITKFFIILLILNIIFIVLICFLLIYFLKVKPAQQNENNNINNEPITKNEVLEENKNSIEATYKIKEGQSISLFNPNEMNLKEGDYIIYGEIITEKKENLRHLKSIAVENGNYLPTESGILNLRINFINNLKTLNNCFKNCKELIKVNLTNLEMKEIISMDSTFSDCSNLKQINLEGINTQNLMEMKYTFENCNELKNINLSPIKTFEYTKIENIFSGCEKLEIINISSFENLENNMFQGIKSKPNIIGNTYISKQITNIFYNLFNVYVNVTIIKTNNPKPINETNQCIIGEKEKCKKCSETIPENCLICNEGYYLPINEYENKICLSCNKIDHCTSCYGDKKFITCSSCEEEYYLENNNCMKKVDSCEIGEGEKCKSCNKNKDLQNQCLTCNDGYYLPKENKSICESCYIIQNCDDCVLKNDILNCLKCKEGFNLINNKCVEKMCEIGKNEKCASCVEINGRKRECLLCNEGYYISHENPYICQKCSINNCKNCLIKNEKEICLECKDTFAKIKDSDGLVYSCECPYGNITEDGLCINKGNWIELTAQQFGAIYDIINFNRINDISANDIDFYLDNKLTSFNFPNKIVKYKFGDYKIHNIKINIKKQLKSMESLFDYCSIVLSVSFLQGFDASQVTSMRRMFFCTYIETIDMKNLEFNNLLDISNCFDNAPYNFRVWQKVSDKAIIDFSSIDTSKVNNCLGIFHMLYDTYIIKISNKFTKCKEFIPFNNQVINIDDLACNKFENCKKCIGSAETLSCIQCNTGYYLLGDKCIKPKCILGEKEKCHICNKITNKENECSECNEGYYLSLYSKDKTSCVKCQTDNCKRCNNNGICQICKPDYEAIIEKNIITFCSPKCELGGNKCLTCDNEKGAKKCSSCNSGYKLMKNGSCRKIENSLFAIYKVNSINEPTCIMDIDSSNIELSDFDMYVNGTKVSPIKEMFWYPIEGVYAAYTFEKTGIYEIKIVFKKTLTLLIKLFQRCYDLISIIFNEGFDTSHVLSMEQMFYECTSLEYVNISSFNTSLFGNYYGIFYGCPKLTSLDLSNFEGTYCFSPNGMFYYSNNLKFIDLSSFWIGNKMWCYLGLDSTANNRTIIIHRNFSCRIEEGWNILYKD